MQVLRKKIVETLLTSVKAKNRLAYEFNVHSATIDRWLKNENPMLTIPSSLAAIADELKVTKDELLEDVA